MLALTPVSTSNLDDLIGFLRGADLTLSGLDSPRVRLWIARDADTGLIYASTGFETSDDGHHVLIRSVAVDAARRHDGTGRELARFAMHSAAAAGAEQAWLFSRRSGPFWQKLGFAIADRNKMALALASTHQVQLFTRTGQLEIEVAWNRTL